MSEVDKLKVLGSGSTKYSQRLDPAVLEYFNNRHPNQEYVVQFETEEFTSLCPKTGQPDFAKIEIKYVPDKRCIESKSLKLYLGSYRNEGMFMEQIVCTILDHLFDVSDPRMMIVTGFFRPRGGITQMVKASRAK